MKNKHAQKLGKLGGEARALVLTEHRRIEIARKAAAARWKNHAKKAKA